MFCQSRVDSQRAFSIWKTLWRYKKRLVLVYWASSNFLCCYKRYSLSIRWLLQTHVNISFFVSMARGWATRTTVGDTTNAAIIRFKQTNSKSLGLKDLQTWTMGGKSRDGCPWSAMKMHILTSVTAHVFVTVCSIARRNVKVSGRRRVCCYQLGGA